MRQLKREEKYLVLALCSMLLGVTCVGAATSLVYGDIKYFGIGAAIATSVISFLVGLGYFIVAVE